MSRERRRFTAEAKAQIVRRHLAGKEPVSKLAEQCGVQPTAIALFKSGDAESSRLTHAARSYGEPRGLGVTLHLTQLQTGIGRGVQPSQIHAG